jgi:hypothetical protein
MEPSDHSGEAPEERPEPEDSSTEDAGERFRSDTPETEREKKSLVSDPEGEKFDLHLKVDESEAAPEDEKELGSRRPYQDEGTAYLIHKTPPTRTGLYTRSTCSC